MKHWKKQALGDVLEYTQPSHFIVKNTQYDPEFQIPVLTPGKSFILGYTNEQEGIYDRLPTIIFDDFTTAFKYVDFPFKVKSSAMKMLNTTCVNFDIKFIYYLMQTINFEAKEHKRYWISKYSQLQVRIPPLEEQKKIAAILDAADAYRQKTKALIDKYDQFTQSLFLDMFGDPVTNPMGWGTQKVKDVATIVRGSSPRPKGDPRYYGSGVPRLMVADLTRDGLYVTPKIDSLTKEGAKKSRPMNRGELVMAVSGRPGLTAILEENCCIHDGFAGFKNIASQYRTEFLCHYFHHFISQVSKVSAGAIFKNITTNDIRMIDLLKIPLERQDYFLKHHQSILRSKILAEASLVKAEELFSSLLQRAFKGELTS